MMNDMFLLLAAALLAPVADEPQTVFVCTVGHKRIMVTQRSDMLTYSFGPAGQAELTLNGNPNGGVFYHETSFPRGEDQTLRFVSGAWSYVIFNRYEAPPNQQGHRHMIPEHNVSGLLVMQGLTILRRIDCDRDSGDLIEWPIFKRLKRDDNDLTPDDA